MFSTENAILPEALASRRSDSIFCLRLSLNAECIRPTSFRLQAVKSPREGLTFFCLLFLCQDKKRRWGRGGDAPSLLKAEGCRSYSYTYKVQRQDGMRLAAGRCRGVLHTPLSSISLKKRKDAPSKQEKTQLRFSLLPLIYAFHLKA